MIHPVAQGSAEENAMYASRQRALTLPKGRGEPSIEGAESGIDCSTVTAGSLRTEATRVPERPLRDESTWPPQVFLLGARHGQEVTCFAVDQAERSSPHSEIKLQREVRAEPVALRQVLAEHGKAGRTNIEFVVGRLLAHAPLS